MKLKYLKNVKDPSIAKEKYKWSDQINTKLDYKKWTEFIEVNKDYYIWLEDSEKGKERLANIDKIPENFRDGALDSLNKRQAYAEYNNKKGWYEIIINFNMEYGIVHTTFQKKITKAHLRRLLEMANHLDAYLLNSGKTVIDEEVIEELE